MIMTFKLKTGVSVEADKVTPEDSASILEWFQGEGDQGKSVRVDNVASIHIFSKDEIEEIQVTEKG